MNPLVTGSRNGKSDLVVKTNIYIVEDHPIMQQTLHAHLRRFPDVTICGIADSAEEALIAIPEANAKLVIVDVSLPGMSGIELVGQLQQLQPDLCCLMLSGHQDMVYVKMALAAGACGYLEKGKPKELAVAIKQVLAGKIYLSESIRQNLIKNEKP